jgi:tetratricopeptide (TPR) repeat protein
MQNSWRRLGWVVGAAALGLVGAGCRTVGSAARADAEGGPRHEVAFEPLLVTGDPELEELNDEELFAKGTAAFGAQDYRQAVRFFGRIVDFHPASPHRAAALFNAGLSYERLEQWEDALHQYAELSDPERGSGDALDAAFREATMLYLLERYDEAIRILSVVGERQDVPALRRLQARVERGICEKDKGDLKTAEHTLRDALALHASLPDAEEGDDFLPAQAQFHLAEVYRLYYEAVELDPRKGVEQLSRDLDYKAELLLSAQGHYLRCVRIGHGEWATAAGAQVGGLYEDLWEHMVGSATPPELDAEQAAVYRSELRKKVRILLSKAINIYERTLETAVRIGAQNGYVDRTREALQRMKDLLLAEARADDEEAGAEPEPSPPPPAAGARVGGPRS